MAHAQPTGRAVPASWSDVDKTLSYEVALSDALRQKGLGPLRAAQKAIAAEGTPTHARLMARLDELARDKNTAFQVGPCHYAAVLIRGMVLSAYEASGQGQRTVDEAPTDEQAAQYAEHIGRCERLGRRTPSQRLIGAP